MTAITIAPPAAGELSRARPAGFLHDLMSIAGRALRAVPRDPAAVMPPIFIALFFFIVNIATLKKLTGSHRFRDSDRDPSRRDRRLQGPRTRPRCADSLP